MALWKFPQRVGFKPNAAMPHYIQDEATTLEARQALLRYLHWLHVDGGHEASIFRTARLLGTAEANADPYDLLATVVLVQLAAPGLHQARNPR